jgi:hypothetical protein
VNHLVLSSIFYSVHVVRRVCGAAIARAALSNFLFAWFPALLKLIPAIYIHWVDNKSNERMKATASPRRSHHMSCIRVRMYSLPEFQSCMELLGHGWRPNIGGPGNLSIRPIRFYYRIRELNFLSSGSPGLSSYLICTTRWWYSTNRRSRSPSLIRTLLLNSAGSHPSDYITLFNRERSLYESFTVSRHDE